MPSPSSLLKLTNIKLSPEGEVNTGGYIGFRPQQRELGNHERRTNILLRWESNPQPSTVALLTKRLDGGENFSINIKSLSLTGASLNFIRLLRVVFSPQQRLNDRPLMPSSDVITTRKPGSDFDWLIV